MADRKRPGRDARLWAGGCGGGNPIPLDAPPPPGQAGAPSDFDHWHTGPLDNSVVRTATFRIPTAFPEGSYSVGIDAHSRGFNPAGDGGGPAINWLTDYAYLQCPSEHRHRGDQRVSARRATPGGPGCRSRVAAGSDYQPEALRHPPSGGWTDPSRGRYSCPGHGSYGEEPD